MYSRRRVLKTVTAASALSVIGGPRTAQAEFHANLNASFSELGFDPAAPGNTFVVLVADIHIDPTSRVYNTPTIDDRLVNTIMAINPPPARIVFLGDLAISCTEAFGMTFTEEARTRALAELQRGKQELERFAPIPMSLILGNHDTYNYDTDGSVMRQVFTTLPAYQLLEIGGMKWFLLNGNHSGYIDATQEAWLAGHLATIDPAEELVICVHQPSLSSPSAERGIGHTIGRVFAAHTGKLWMFSGHGHAFTFYRYSLPKTTISSLGVTTANPEAFSDRRNPGFMVVCMSNGHIFGTVRRDCKQAGYEIFDHRQRNAPTRPLPKTWSSVPYPIRLFEEGSYDRRDILISAIANDTRTWWAYTGSLTFRVPMNPRADQFLLLAGVIDPPPIFEFSIDDGLTWLVATNVTAVLPEQVHTVPLPHAVRNTASPLVRVSAPGDRYGSDWVVAGFGLAASPETVSSLERWRYAHFGTIFNEGAASLNANPAEDGLNNLAKFAFGLDPKKPDRRTVDPQNARLGGEPLLKVLKTAAGVGLQATFVRRTADATSGIKYQIEHSNDLEHWRKVTANVETVTPVQEGWELVNTWIPHSMTGPAEYWRVHVFFPYPYARSG